MSQTGEHAPFTDAISIARGVGSGGFGIRRASVADVPAIKSLVLPLSMRRILLDKELVVFYESIQEFRVAVDESGRVIGFGAVHVIWDDLGEVRTLAVDESWRGRGVGHALLDRLESDARALGLARLFCLTFETGFFEAHGYHEIGEANTLLPPEVIAELVRSPDEGVAEFLDLARAKQNTLGNTRMLKLLG